MKISHFNPPANQDDFGSPDLLKKYSDYVSSNFNQSIAEIKAVLSRHHAGQPQFYNPLENENSAPDALLMIPWNGFPRRFLKAAAGGKTDYASAEPDQLAQSDGQQFRQQDEYLEWFVHRDDQGKITRIDFTCEAYDYFEFLASLNPNAVVTLYANHIAPGVSENNLKAELFPNGIYNSWNAFNTIKGAMHLTHPANALGAEIKLAADATVRRDNGSGEPTSPATLIQCAQFGDGDRNSDPAIGYKINQKARDGYLITLTDPVGLYMIDFDDRGWNFADGTSASGFMTIIRGRPGRAIRAIYELPSALKAQGRTISDIQIGGVPIEYGGQIAEHVTMGIEGAACLKDSVHNSLVPCSPIRAATEVASGLIKPMKRTR
ncbi:hypothetical protein [Mycetohabitans endofungorum]|uniref:hypothetical protein n=1 Tax=Mycetohabitans endofungorum TaxID=417203 RepID=UPI002B060F20|nr:hypothetical protein [Mycetohabitans endofungorum]